jgi:hypothetical protein
MFSTSTFNNIINRVECYVVAGRKLFARRNALRVFLSDFWDFTVWDFDTSILVAPANRLGVKRCSVTALAHHVLRVVFVCTLPQMRRVTAKAIVAFMTNNKPVVSVSMRQEKRNAVSKHDYISNSIAAISWAMSTSYPYPAITVRPLSRSLVNFFPESFLFLCGQRGNVTIGLSHEFFSLIEKFVVRAAERVNARPARFAL